VVNTPSTVPTNVGTPSPSREKEEGMAKMNFQLIEKIRPLVKSSVLLNETERQEWLMLLELMNDKQLVELQRILEPASQLASKQYAVNSTQQETQAKISATAGTTSVIPEKEESPRLKHILNFPSTPASRHRDVTSEVFVNDKVKAEDTLSSDFANQPPHKATGGQEASSDKPVFARSKSEGKEIAKSGFLSSLKNVLGKKELKPGHAEFQLELSSSVPQSGTMADKKNKNVEIPDALKTILHHKDLGHPAVLKQLPPVVPAPAKKLTESVPAKVVLPIAKSKPISFSSPVNKFVPGVQLPNLPEGASVKGLDKARPEKPREEISLPKKPLASEIPGNKVEIKSGTIEPRTQLKPSYSNLKLKNLEDATKLSPAVLESVDINEMAKKIKSLMDSEGYYQTIFSLEKSALFKQYLLTGLDSLYKEVSVEELAQEHPNQYLTKEQFEKFTDLLMVSQSG